MRGKAAQKWENEKEPGSSLGNQRGMALIICLLMLVVVTTIGLTSIMTSSMEIRLGGNERVTSETLYAAEAGVQHALQALRGQNFDMVVAAAAGQPWLTVNDFNGVQGLDYLVDVSKTNQAGQLASTGSIFITSTATHPSGGKKVIEAEVRNPATIIPVNSSVGIVGNFSEMEFEGTTFINGDLPAGEPGVPGSDCAENKAGVAVDTVNAYSQTEVDDDAIITGIGLSPSIQLRPQDMSAIAIETLAYTIAAKADRTIVVDESNDNDIEIGDKTWGTATNPEVTVISMQGEDVELEFEGNVGGYGILIINSSNNEDGEVEFDGNFTWNGLIIITGDAEFELEIEGDEATTITGAIIIANTAANTTDLDFEIETEGNTTIQYSCNALTNAMNYSPLLLEGWHEI
ncbi:MAG: PilX N-terminal domain-containing pilus assembly protein [Nitrospiria bacterium]